MRLVDFQNHLANMPLTQQIHQTQHTQSQAAPITVIQKFEEQIREENSTVQESKEQAEKSEIKEEDERGFIERRSPRRRAKSLSQEEKNEEKKTRANDGVHGRFLDIEA